MNIVERELTITYDNVKNVSASDKVTLGVAATAFAPAVAYRIYTSHTHKEYYAYLTQGGLNLLFPNDTAKPFKADAGVVTASRFAGSTNNNNQMWAYLNGTTTTALNVTTSDQDKIDYGITSGVAGITKSQADFRVYLKHASGAVAVGGNAYFKLYFYQYTCSANAVGNGIQSASVSNSSPYEGDTVTFTPKLVNGATWDGWYSDASCTQLVSTEQNYTTSAADLTLYAKATIAAVVYNCSAVAGENITSASVSDESVVSGDSVTFTAQLNEHCTFEGWFADSNYATLVSTANPYTATITSDTTLYAKGIKISYSVSVGTAEHGTATVSANTAHYGDSVTFTFTPEDETWELYGWYSDEGLTQLVSENNPYTHSVTGNVTLYPKVGKKRYTISIGRDTNILSGSNFQIDIVVLYYEQLTRTEINYLRTGEYNKIDASKILLQDSVSGNNVASSIWKTIKCPYDTYVAVYAPPKTTLGDTHYSWFIKDNEVVTNWPYYWFQPVKDTQITSRDVVETHWCNCSAIPKEGIDYAYATTPTRQDYDAVFEAEVSSGYTFSGWYSNEACTTLVSTDNPAYITTPKYTTSSASTTSLTLYAKATANTTGTGIFLKQNGTFVEANAVYKKINGAWVQQTDIVSIKTELQSGNYKLN